MDMIELLGSKDMLAPLKGIEKTLDYDEPILFTPGKTGSEYPLLIMFDGQAVEVCNYSILSHVAILSSATAKILKTEDSDRKGPGPQVRLEILGDKIAIQDLLLETHHPSESGPCGKITTSLCRGIVHDGLNHLSYVVGGQIYLGKADVVSALNEMAPRYSK